MMKYGLDDPKTHRKTHRNKALILTCSEKYTMKQNTSGSADKGSKRKIFNPKHTAART